MGDYVTAVAEFNSTNINHSEFGPPSLPGYEIIRRLGAGAGSVIYAVRQEKTGKSFALKHVVRRDDDKRMLDQVENEFKVASKIDHPYIRKIYHIERRKKRLQTREILLVMEFCPGVSLEQSPARSLLDLLLIFRMVADGIGGMHNAGWLHCDMKPNNIIIAENGAIRIIDLGQSCPVGTIKRRIQGTPDYIAPEQVRRKPLSRQTDVFNLGATLYWALTGRHVPTLIPKNVAGDTSRLALVSANAGSKPISPTELKPQIPQGISNLVMDCVKQDPNQRPADMQTLISRIDVLIHMIAGGKLTPSTTSK
ncbi:MAG: serine/threonine protein kinase [Sedimentisphaerales bacterium]|nr:serine/threonine protein kinase [Sedimentisphaerales bacterium]